MLKPLQSDLCYQSLKQLVNDGFPLRTYEGREGGVYLGHGLGLSTILSSLPRRVERCLSFPTSTWKFFPDLASVTHLCIFLLV